MSSRNIANQEIHDKIISHLFKELCTKGYENVFASHIELPEDKIPKIIFSENSKMTFCPDLYAEKDGALYLFEVETEDSIGWSLTKAEFECFAQHAKKCEGYFYVVVPEMIREKAESILNEIDLRNRRKTFILTV